MNADEGVLLLIGSGWHPYREYLLRGLTEHAPVWLIDDQPPSWQLPYLAGSSVVGQPDAERVSVDRAGLLAAAQQVAAERKVAGVLTYDEMLVTATAQIAESLGLRGLTVAGAENCRDKSRTRAALTAARLPQPRYELVADLAGALAAADRIGYPVVTKPRGMGASVGVARSDDPGQLASAFAVLDRVRLTGPAVYQHGVLVEELVDGEEISVDAAVSGGEYRPFCLARKHLGAPPYFEEVGHLVDAADPLVDDRALRGLLSEAHAALGVLDGMTHTEVRLTSRGPVIIEVNARLGGDLIPYLGKLATGVDPGRVAAEVATGAPLSLTPTRHGCAGVRFCYPPVDCRVIEVTVPEPAAVPGLFAARAIAEPGSVLRLPPNVHLGRHAYLIAVAAGRADCARTLDRAAGLVTLRHAPLDPGYQGRPW